jgi:Alternative complex III, ActD subunit
MKGQEALYGLFATAEAAERAAEALERLGVARSQIAVLSSEPWPESGFARSAGRTAMPWIAALGGLLGGLSGYALAAYTERSFPLVTGGMAIVPMWPNGIVMYELAMLFAILGVLVTFLGAARLPDWRRRMADAEIWTGKILVGVAHPSGEARARIEAALVAAGSAVVRAIPAG